MGDYSIKPSGLTKKNIAAIFFVALIARFFNAVLIDDIAVYAFEADSPIYWEGAKAWLESGFFSRVGANGYIDETERVPLYNLFLLPFRWIFEDAIWPVIIAQSFMDSVTCILIGLMGSQLGRPIGLVAAFMAAGWPNLIIHSQQILSESLFLFLFTGVLYFSAKFLQTVKLSDALIIGALCGAAIMTRPVALYIPLSMAVVGPLISRKRLGRWIPGVVASVAMICASLVVISPLLWRNVSNYGSYQLSAQGGTHLLNWVVGYVNSLDRGTTFTEEAKEIQRKYYTQGMLDRQKVVQVNPFAIAASQVEFAKQEFLKIPISSILRAWSYGAALNLGTPAIVMDPRIRSYNRNSLMDSTGSTLLNRLWSFFKDNHPTYLSWVAIGMAASVGCTVLQLWGLLVLLRTAFWPAVFGTLVISYFLLASGPIGTPKYRIPFEPVLIVFQAVAMIQIWTRFRLFK